MSDDFDQLKREYDRLKAKELAAAKREAVEAFYAAVELQVLALPRRKEPISGQHFTYIKLDDVLATSQAEIAKWREG